MATLSTHVLDTSRGRPAAGLTITVEVADGDGWAAIGGGATNDDGRVPGLLPEGTSLEAKVYRITFATAEYFAAQGVKGFYPKVEIFFEIHTPGEHYHVPLLLNPFGFSTYRGS